MFLIYRVELKGLYDRMGKRRRYWFLIYRVELKGGGWCIYKYNSKAVPNLPCGVESASKQSLTKLEHVKFLIYRVELKVPCKSN